MTYNDMPTPITPDDLRAYLESFDPEPVEIVSFKGVTAEILQGWAPPVTPIDWSTPITKPDDSHLFIYATDTSTTDAERKRIVGIVRRDDDDEKVRLFGGLDQP